jgi:septal ring factor EnvC (AmiA/AmiB activator)
MSKLTKLDKETMVKHLKELNKLSLIANSENSKNIQKQIDHTIVLTDMMLEDRAKISRLENVIDIKQREIDELNRNNNDLLWDLAKLQKKCGSLEKEIEMDEKKAAQVQKNLARVFKNESVDN